MTHRNDYNLGLAKSWFEKQGLRYGEPPIVEQLPTVVINPHSIFKFGYNPSLIRYGKRLLMAYRYHPGGQSASKLAIAELGEDFRVSKNAVMDIADGKSVEDPRLFTYDGQLCISYVVSNVPDPNARCVVRWGMVDETSWRITGQWMVQHGQNNDTGREKNWVFYEDRGHVRCIYQSYPEVERLTVNQASVDTIEKCKSMHWKYGQQKGGSQPFKQASGECIRFFHSRLDNGPSPIRHRYYVGAFLTDSEGHVKAVSKKPILRGSEFDTLTEAEHRECSHYKPNVVFPCGAIENGDGWLLSVGINDCQCAIVKVEKKDLNL